MINRRSLLTWGGLAAACVALPCRLKAAVVAAREKPLPRLDSEEVKPAVCKLCPSLCMLQIRVVNGKPVGVAGMQGHPVSRGSHCPKGGAVLQELYHPDRLRSPMLRKGARGSGEWSQVSWEEARRILLGRLSNLRQQGRPEALAVLAAPIRDIRHEIQRRFASAFGTPNFWEWNWALAEGPVDAFQAMHGSSEGLFYDLNRANLVMSFGWDWLQSSLSPVEAQRAMAELRRGKVARRTRVVQVEPRLSITASKADEWIAARPGTEGILALGVCRALIEGGLHDKEFIGRWTEGFEEFRSLVREAYPPERVSQATGVSAVQVARLAAELASVKPSLAVTCRGRMFDQLAVHSLNLLVGSIGVRRGVLASAAGRYQLRLPPVSGVRPGAGPLCGLHELPEAVISASASPVEVLWLERVNPVFLSPGPERWRKALERIPFIVSFSSFMDESSSLADLVLPPHSCLEAWQYGFSATLEGNGVVSFAPPVTAPLHDTGDHGDFILSLAHGLGGGVASALPWKTFVESLGEAAGQAQVGEAMRHGGWREREAARPDVSSAVSTASGKLRFPAKVIAANDPPPTRDAGYPFHLHVHVPLAFSFGDGAHLPYLHGLAGAHLGSAWETWVEIHPAAAKTLGIADGRMVRVESPKGSIRARARHYEGIRQDTVSLPFGLGHTGMGRYCQGIGANPAELLGWQQDSSGQPSWQGARVRVHAA